MPHICGENMANIFLDANYWIDAIYRKTTALPATTQNTLYISPLSVQIFCYSYKISVPNTWINEVLNEVRIVDLRRNIFNKALLGPTSDLEDNIQLHSAVAADCDLFLTHVKKLVSLSYFGRMRIAEQIK